MAAGISRSKQNDLNAILDVLKSILTDAEAALAAGDLKRIAAELESAKSTEELLRTMIGEPKSIDEIDQFYRDRFMDDDPAGSSRDSNSDESSGDSDGDGESGDSD